MKVGLLFCRGGPAGLWGPSAQASAIVAAAEINAAGGVLGRPVELLVRDLGTTESEAREATRALMDIDQVDALVAMHPSNTRDVVAQAVANRVPYIYTPQFEGGSVASGTIAIGGTDATLLRPALAWLADNMRASRFFLVGSDYIWPRTTHVTAARLITDVGGSVVGVTTLPFGTEDYDPLFAHMRRAVPDVVLLSLLGVEAVRFNRAFRAAELDRRFLRLAIAQDETVLYASGVENTENMLIASHYLADVSTSNNDHFLELYHAAFGAEAPPANTFGRSCYEGMHTLTKLARNARSLTPSAIQQAATSARCSGSRPGGKGPIYLAEIAGFTPRVVKAY